MLHKCIEGFFLRVLGRIEQFVRKPSFSENQKAREMAKNSGSGDLSNYRKKYYDIMQRKVKCLHHLHVTR
jgi:hypothetical protein